MLAHASGQVKEVTAKVETKRTAPLATESADQRESVSLTVALALLMGFILWTKKPVTGCTSAWCLRRGGAAAPGPLLPT